MHAQLRISRLMLHGPLWWLVLDYVLDVAP